MLTFQFQLLTVIQKSSPGSKGNIANSLMKHKISELPNIENEKVLSYANSRGTKSKKIWSLIPWEKHTAEAVLC